MEAKVFNKDKESVQLGSVRDFFDGHASDYKKKYGRKDKFYEYFFFERLEKATSSIDFQDKWILDIGAGTGPLYDYLVEKNLNTFRSYEATDISKGMLDQSNIPNENRYPGDFLEIDFKGKYDLIFMLGVSTYLSEQQMEVYVNKVQSLLVPGGSFIVTFTHLNSLDIRIRQLLTPAVRLFAKDDKVISQSFKTKFYSHRKSKALFMQDFKIDTVEGLNHTVFPISRIAPSLSIRIARLISKLRESFFKRFLSSDLLYKVIKK